MIVLCRSECTHCTRQLSRLSVPAKTTALGVAGSAVGITSLGIKVGQGLLAYYDDWKDYKSDIGGAFDLVADLSKTLGLLQGSLEPGELDDERSQRVKSCLKTCEDSLTELSEKL